MDPTPWFSDIPPLPPSLVPILTPQGGASVIAILLKDIAVCRYVHWRHERTVPCAGFAVHCDHCLAYAPKKLKGWISAWLPDCSRHCLVEMTHAAMVAATPDTLLNPPFKRGWRIRVSRYGEGKRARTKIDLSPTDIDPDTLPEPLDERRQLEQIWAGNGDWLRRRQRDGQQ